MPELPVVLALTGEVFETNPLDAVWHRPDRNTPLELTDRLQWRWNIPEEAATPALVLPSDGKTALAKPSHSLRAWANSVVASNGTASGSIPDRDRLAAISLLTSLLEKEVLEYLSRHPFLTARELSIVLRLPSEAAADRLLTSLSRYGLLESVQGSTPRLVYHYLTALGLKVLAAREGVPPKRIALHGNVIAKLEGAGHLGRLRPMLRQLDHSVGTNGYFVRLIADAQLHGKVLQWRMSQKPGGE
jgi:hypothetical protein